jgi:hypothetical protein
VWEVGTESRSPIESSPADPGSAVSGAPVVARDPFPLFSVQEVAALAWRLALRVDPLGLLVLPFAILFPVYVFVTQLKEIVSAYATLALDDPVSAGALGDAIPFGALLGVLPLVIVAASFGVAWIHVRADGEARGEPLTLGRTAERALGRIWPLALTTAIAYALWQVAAFVFVLPGLVVLALTSFAPRAAVLDGLGPWAALKRSKDLVVRHWAACLGMAAYWLIVFFGLGLLVGIAGQSLAEVPGASSGWTNLALDLLLGLPLPVAYLVFETCWTLFFRELEARSRVRAAKAAA